MSEELETALARVADAERDNAFIWRWIERAIYDRQISAGEALSVLANSPIAPWNQGRWNVDHKPYAAKLYADHPTAAANQGKEG